MISNNQTYNLFLTEDYSAKEIVNFLYQEISIVHSPNRFKAVIENLELLVDRLKLEIYNLKTHLIYKIGMQLRSFSSRLKEAIYFLENLIYKNSSEFKIGKEYKLKKLQQMKHEIAVLGLYLEV